MANHKHLLTITAAVGLLVVLAAAAWSPSAAHAAPAQASETQCGIGFPDATLSDAGRQVWKPDSGFRHFVCVFLDISPQSPVPERAEIVPGWAPTFAFDRSLQVTTPSGVLVVWGSNEAGSGD